MGEVDEKEQQQYENEIYRLIEHEEQDENDLNEDLYNEYGPIEGCSRIRPAPNYEWL